MVSPTPNEIPPLLPRTPIRVVTPSGRYRPANVERARAYMLDRGHEPITDDVFQAGMVDPEDPTWGSPFHYLADSLQHRLLQMIGAYQGEQAHLWAFRGGYGATQLLPGLLHRLEEYRERARNKLLIGFSDITALHCFHQQYVGGVCLHGPVLNTLPDQTPEAVHHLFHLLKEDTQGYEMPLGDLRCARSGNAEGILLGGNLTLLTALCGTPFQPDTSGKILFLEDIGEIPYRYDREIQQLAQAGIFENLSGLILGDITTQEVDRERMAEHITNCLLEVIPARLPMVRGARIGHIADNMAVPIGIRARLEADRGRVILLESLVKV